MQKNYIIIFIIISTILFIYILTFIFNNCWTIVTIHFTFSAKKKMCVCFPQMKEGHMGLELHEDNRRWWLNWDIWVKDSFERLWVFWNVSLTWLLQQRPLLLYCAAAALYATCDKSDAVSSSERGTSDLGEGPLLALCNWKGTCNRHQPPSQRAEHCCCHSRMQTEKTTRTKI